VQHLAAFDRAVQAGDRYEQARAQHCLGRLYQATGDTDLARRHWQEALTRYADLGVPEAEEVRAKLARADLASITSVT